MAKKSRTRLKFTCPNCQGHALEEIATCSSMTSPVKAIYSTGSITYTPPDVEDVEIERFQCSDCGFVIGGADPITDPKKLAAWLKRRMK